MSDSENASLVAEVLSSYLSNNTVAPADLRSVIETVKAAFGVTGGATLTPDVEEPKKLEPAVSIKKSVTQDALICLNCGKSFKSLKRHLQTEHGQSPDEYRAAYGLKAEYPIVAPNYSAQRSTLALSAGLGRKAAEPVAEKKVVAKKPGGRKPATKEAAE